MRLLPQLSSHFLTLPVAGLVVVGVLALAGVVSRGVVVVAGFVVAVAGDLVLAVVGGFESVDVARAGVVDAVDCQYGDAAEAEADGDGLVALAVGVAARDEPTGFGALGLDEARERLLVGVVLVPDDVRERGSSVAVLRLDTGVRVPDDVRDLGSIPAVLRLLVGVAFVPEDVRDRGSIPAVFAPASDGLVGDDPEEVRERGSD